MNCAQKLIFDFVYFSLELSTTVSAEILASHRRLHRALFMAVFCVYVAALLLVYPNALLVSHAYDLRSPADVLFLLVIGPLHIFYWIYGKRNFSFPI